MQFRVLGPLEVSDGKRLLDLGPRMPRLVLAALLIDANRVVSLDRLLDRLWGESPPPQAVGSLQVHVSRLRRVLEPHRQPRTPAQVLVTDPPGYRLAVRPDDFDAAVFERRTRDGQAHLRDGRPQAAKEAFEAGLSLWRGAAYADVAFEAFVRMEADRLEELHLAAREGLIEADLGLGGHAAVVTDLERLVAEHPLRERLWELLMLALYRCGRQGEALRAFQRARAVLGEELGIEPGVGLRQVETAILEQDASLTWRPPSEPAGPLAAFTPGEHTRPSNDTTALVGRNVELTQLTNALATAVRGRGGLALLSGDAGIGKTTLAEAVSREAQELGARVVWGRCHEGEGAPPMWPWVQVVRELLTSAPPDAARTALAPGASDIAQMVPEVKELVGDVKPPPHLEPEAARFRLYDAISASLLRLASATPLVVVVDDLHWADPPSLQLLELLVTQLHAAPLFVVATYRNAEIAAGHPLGNTLGALARRAVVRIGLRGLEASDVASYLAAAGLGRHPNLAEVAEVLHARTDGNPLFVTELVRLLQAEGGRSLHADVVASGVPTGIRDVVRRRLAPLPDDAVTLLQVAAVIGRDFTLDVLAESSGLDEDRVLELLEGPLLLGVVDEVEAPAARFRFSHALIREAMYEELNPLRRPRVHQRVGEALERVHGLDPRYATEIAYHLGQAASRGGVNRAIDWALRAADHAAAQLAFEQRENQLRHALRLVERLPEGAARDRRELDVLLRLSALITVTRSYAAPESGAALVRAKELCERIGDRRQLAGVLWRLVAYHSVGARFGPARELAGELLDTATASGEHAELVVGHGAVAIAALHRGEVKTALAHLEQARALPKESHDPSLAFWHPVVMCSSFLAWALALLGDDERAAATAEEGVRFAASIEDVFGEVHVRFFEAKVAALARDVPRTRRKSEEALNFANERGFFLYVALSRVLLGWAVAEQGEPPAGIREIESGVAAMEATSARMLQTWLLGLLAEARWRAADVGEALVTVDRALAAADQSQERFYEPELRCLHADLILASAPQRIGAAADELRAAIAAAESSGAARYEQRARDKLALLLERPQRRSRD